MEHQKKIQRANVQEPDRDDWNQVHQQLSAKSAENLLPKVVTDTDPRTEGRYGGAGPNELNRKFGSSFYTDFFFGNFKSYESSIPVTQAGQELVMTNISGFDFESLQNEDATKDDAGSPPKLELQSITTYRVDASGKYIGDSRMTYYYKSHATYFDDVVDDPGMRDKDEVMDIQINDPKTGESIFIFVRLQIPKPTA